MLEKKPEILSLGITFNRGSRYTFAQYLLLSYEGSGLFKHLFEKYIDRIDQAIIYVREEISLLRYSIINRKKELAKALFDSFPTRLSDNEIVLILGGAIRNNDIDILKALYSAGVNVNYTFSSRVSSSTIAKYYTALHFAAVANDIPIIEYLLDLGANIEPYMLLEKAGSESAGAMYQQQTPLLVACRSGSVEAFAYLLDRGANIFVNTHSDRMRFDDLPQFTAMGIMHMVAYKNKDELTNTFFKKVRCNADMVFNTLGHTLSGIQAYFIAIDVHNYCFLRHILTFKLSKTQLRILLYHSCNTGDTTAFEMLRVKADGYININTSRKNLLFSALTSRTPNIEMIDFLIKSGANPCFREEDDRLPCVLKSLINLINLRVHFLAENLSHIIQHFSMDDLTYLAEAIDYKIGRLDPGNDNIPALKIIKEIALKEVNEKVRWKRREGIVFLLSSSSFGNNAKYVSAGSREPVYQLRSTKRRKNG